MSAIQEIEEVGSDIEITREGRARFTIHVSPGHREWQLEASAEHIDLIIERLQSVSDRLKSQ